MERSESLPAITVEQAAGMLAELRATIGLAMVGNARGYRTLGEDGLLKVLLGETSLAEALQARV